MRFPTILIERGSLSTGFTAEFGRCFAIKRSVNTFLVVIILEFSELSFQINRIPE